MPTWAPAAGTGARGSWPRRRPWHVSVVYGEVARDTPQAHLVTAGFHPLRDEGQSYADKLRSGGVPVTAVHEADLPHGVLPFVHLVPRAQFGRAGCRLRMSHDRNVFVS
ncbi:alpha/beta hydrolase fold domain-containing protein [Streptomyces sp. NPDC021218]|uniref:alpha/beta hydrolase fold domain-containing protein n=1 Tax=unclassified Streptomyces TaxID=2593676 RepID=UPI0036868CDC